MSDRYADPVPAILMADRGCESFNTFAHLIRKEIKFVIRMKDINSNGILSSYDLPDSEFDTYIRTTLTRRHTKETLGNPNTYTILQASTDFDFLDEAVFITILNSGLYVFALIMEPMSALQPIFRKMIAPWKKSKSFTGCAGAWKQASVNSNTPSV